MTQLRIAEPPDGSYYDAYPGEMWPCPHDPGSHHVEGRMRCWVVRLPGGGYAWHSNVESTQEGEGLWNVSGEPPNITVTPSINVGPEIWHGFITNGALSPDTDVNGQTGGHRHPWKRVLLSNGKTVMV